MRMLPSRSHLSRFCLFASCRRVQLSAFLPRQFLRGCLPKAFSPVTQVLALFLLSRGSRLSWIWDIITPVGVSHELSARWASAVASHVIFFGRRDKHPPWRCLPPPRRSDIVMWTCRVADIISLESIQGVNDSM